MAIAEQTSPTRSLPGGSSGGRIRTAALEGFREILNNRGADFEAILAEASIASENLKDDFNWIPLEKFAGFLTLAAKATGDPCFGLKCGATAPLANPVGYLLSSAPDLRTGLTLFVKYQRVVCTSAETFSEHAGVGKIEWMYPITMVDIAQLTDFVLMRFIIRIQSAAGTSWRPLSVSLAHNEPPDRSEFERFVGTRIEFGQRANKILIASRTLDLQSPASDPELFKLVHRFCEQQIKQLDPVDDSLNRTREVVFRCLQSGEVSPHTVATELDLAPHSLHRLLKEHGTSFQQLLDDTRRSVAERYLFESSLPLTESDTSRIFRAERI